MTTLTLDHLSEPQRQALQGLPARPANSFNQLAGRLAAQADKAATLGRPLVARTLQGYAAMARDLATPDLPERWNVADPAADVPAALLTPCGRYCCDRCEAATERADLVERVDGFLCPECAAPAVAS